MQSPIKEQFLREYDKHADAVFRRCLFKTSDREVARDLSQEAWTRTWDYLVDGKEIDHIKAFVFQVANNLIKDFYKKKKATAMGDMTDFDPQRIVDSLENIEAKARAEEILRMLNEMKTADRDVLTLNIVEGFGPKKIAEIKDERENTVAVQLHRARKRLRQELNGELSNE
jgi:RNA polymerase sigma-70 factor (ECF subfamily)